MRAGIRVVSASHTLVSVGRSSLPSKSRRTARDQIRSSERMVENVRAICGLSR